MEYVELARVVLLRVMLLWTAVAWLARGATKVLGVQLLFAKAAIEGVVNIEVSAGVASAAVFSFKTGAAGSAMIAGKSPPRATKAIRASIICLMGFALLLRCA